MAKRSEIESGKHCKINSDGDLYMAGDLRPYIKGPVGIIEKLTKGGMVLVKFENGETIKVPPKNIDLIEGEIS
jgi:hypothetical protein